jgi:hypothetical protein
MIGFKFFIKAFVLHVKLITYFEFLFNSENGTGPRSAGQYLRLFD